MYMQSRKRKLDFSFSSFLSNSFLLFSPHFPHNLNCQSYSKRKKLTHSEDPNARASSSLTPPDEGCDEGGEEQRKGNHYEVFLSFRGPDTRKGFTDHLYNGLVNAGICAFRDDNELRQGEEIGPDLLTAIKNSKILIPIISVNYASSNWCLDELVQIMECKCNNTGTIVLPIFYKVKPSDVRCQKGSFGNGFRTRKKYSDPATLEKWKQALAKVSALKGWEATGLEGELVKSVVLKVLSELQKNFDVVIPENLVGIDSHVKKVMKFVDNNTSATIFVGIYGMGGIGKTTLAKVIYNKLSNQFEYRSFIADTRELCKRQGLEYLQNQLIYDILQQQDKVRNKDEGISFLSSKFKGKRVLIILDDMDDDDQIKALAGNHNWFSSGSVIIITTRDKSILDYAEVDYPYEHEEMDMDSSLNLFSRHAFQKDMPPKEFEVLTDMVVSVTGGLPLSLEVLGSFLRNKELGVWEDTIKKLRNTTHKKVREKLKISYDELEYGQQQIFLDIACFFIGSDERIASYMWDACNFYPKEGIVVLRSMSLIKVGEDHQLWMHDQLRDLGRDIVRKEDEKHPQYRSRLWESEEIVEMLEEDEGTSKIEALRLYNYHLGRSYTAGKFEKLTNLRFLQVNNVNLTGKFPNLFPRLTWLEWIGGSLDFDVANCHLKKLIVLDLSWSKISEHWGGWDLVKMANRLKFLNLAGCALRTTPDLSVFKTLEILILKRCGDLEKIDPSIENIKTLVSLNVGHCRKLKELPLGVGRMEELRELLINGTGIQKIPISRGCLMKLEILDASNCNLLARLPESLGSLVSLTQLYLHETGIEELPESIGSLKELVILDASYCASLALIPSSIGDLISLSDLDLRECNKLAQLPDSIGSLVSLSHLLLSGCHSLRQLPGSIGKLVSLTKLCLKDTAITKLPRNIVNLQNLQMLDVNGSPLNELLDDMGILAELPESRASGGNDPKGSGELVSPNKLDSDKLKNLSELRSHILSLVLSRCLCILPANNSAMDDQTADSEVNNLLVNILPVAHSCQSLGQNSNSSNDLPRNVVITLSQGSPVESMDFHPVQQTLLLVGTNTGDVILWDVGNRERIAIRNFKVWDLRRCSTALQASLTNYYEASVNCVNWSPDGYLFGVAYSKNMVHIYLYLGGDDIRNHLEIEAHVGSVNDLAFTYPKKQLCVVTCGEDRLIKIWDAVTGAKQYTLEGHEAPVYSICPHRTRNIEFTFSTASDGKIKAWIYDNMGSRVDYDAPGHSSTVMAYSADGTRLFSCGTNKEGESYLVEWNEIEGAVKRTYHGLGKRSDRVVQFDTNKNRFLAVGDEFMVKFWDMDNNNLLTSTDAGGGLPASPCIRFNTEGTLLAVSTSDNSIKILANPDGIRLLRTVENRLF